MTRKNDQPAPIKRPYRALTLKVHGHFRTLTAKAGKKSDGGATEYVEGVWASGGFFEALGVSKASVSLDTRRLEQRGDPRRPRAVDRLDACCAVDVDDRRDPLAPLRPDVVDEQHVRGRQRAAGEDVGRPVLQDHGCYRAEALPALDRVETVEVLRVARLARQGRIVLYSSHVLSTVESICSDVVILHEGQVVAHDTVGRLRDLMSLPSLEEVFRKLAVHTDVDGTADRLIGAISQ